MKIHPIALFRVTVLGPLASRDTFSRGELSKIIRGLSERTYQIPGSSRSHVGAKTIERWYYRWKKGGVDALAPSVRCDANESKLSKRLQKEIIQAKKENPKRSINQIKHILELAGIAGKGELSRSSIYRILKKSGISRCSGSVTEPVEYRSYNAKHCGDIWYGDVMHGPKILMNGQLRKVYLASLMDDASRLIVHSAFGLGETALDIEGVLKQSLLKRGVPKKLIVDNGPAYRSVSLQGICARLEIHLIYCKPYAPEGKGKLEKWHSFVRSWFLAELDVRQIRELDDLNARWWAWVEHVYHQRPHGALEGLTPLDKWRNGLIQIRQLGNMALKLDELFYHRHERKVKKDGTVSFESKTFEVPYELSGKKIILVVEPHEGKALFVENKDGQRLGKAIQIDLIANNQRQRRKPEIKKPEEGQRNTQLNAVELVHQRYIENLRIDADKTLDGDEQT